MTTNLRSVVSTAAAFAAAVSLCLSSSAKPVLRLDDYERLRLATSMDAPDKPPFHLKVDFQLFDLQGTPTTTGTAEEWWSPSTGARFAIQSPTVNLPLPAAADQAPHASRDEALIYELLDSFVHPMPQVDMKHKHYFAASSQKVAGATLDCLEVRTDLADAPDRYCTDPNSTDLRIIVRDGFVRTVRNQAGVFRTSNVALQAKLAYGPEDSISGRVSGLQAIEVATVLAEAPVATRIRPDNGTPVPDRISGTMPDFPFLSRGRPVSGCVVTAVLVGEAGEVRSTDTIYSADPALTKAFTDVVRTWKYKPSLQDGRPVDVLRSESFCVRSFVQ